MAPQGIHVTRQGAVEAGLEALVDHASLFLKIANIRGRTIPANDDHVFERAPGCQLHRVPGQW